MVSKSRKIVIDGLKRFTSKAMRRLQIRLFQILTTETPVLTGFARAGWSPTIGAPDRRGPFESRIKSKTPATRPARDAEAEAIFQIRKASSTAIGKTYKLGDGSIFIVNNVKYIPFLNDGSSAQAPRLFVEMAIVTAVAITSRELKKGG